MPYRALLLAAVSLAGCSLGLEVPDGTAIACQNQNECPEGYVCQVSLSRCVPLGYDVTPPALSGAPEITPTVAGSTATVTISFTTTKPLGLDPVVTLVFGPTVQRSARLTSSTNNDTVFVYAYTPDLSEPQTAASVVIVITDIAGNQGSSESPEALRFDFEAPTVFAEVTELALRPPQPSILASASALTAGGVATLRVQTSEALAPSSRVIVEGADLAFAQIAALGTIYTYELQYTGGASDGLHAVSFEAFDDAGNTTTSPIGTLVIDNVAPAIPDVATTDRILYRRAPWDADITARFSVTAGNAAFEPGVHVAFYDQATTAPPALLLAQGQADANGALTRVALPTVDRQQIYVQAVDDAGNTSATALVQDVEWVGSFDPGTATSPHRAYTFNNQQPKLGIDNGVRVSGAALAALGSIDSSGWTSAQQRPAWRQRSASPAQPARYFGAGAYDARRQEVVTFGGVAASQSSFGSQVFAIWDGVWRTPAATSALPAARFGHVMAYDVHRDRVVLYGGQNGTGLFDETWEWDGARWERHDIPSPGGVTFGAMAYDPDNQRVVLVGGCYDAECSDVRATTWVYDGAWTQLPTNTPPSARFGHSFTLYNGGIVLYGGCPSGATFDASNGAIDCSSYLQDRWRLAGNSWSNITDGTEPPGRAFHAAAWDEADNLYIYGGAPTNTSSDGRIWASDGSDFFVNFDSGQPATGAFAVFHSGLQKVLFFGGIWDGDMDYFLIDQLQTFSTTTAAFTLAASTDLPVRRSNGALTWAPNRQRMVFSGGGTVDGLARGDTMTWDGLAWTTLTGGVPSNVPDANLGSCSGYRGGGRSAFDSTRQRLVSVCDNRTYELQGTGTWNQVCTTGPCNTNIPAATGGYAIAFDSTAQRTLIFGGGNVGAPSRALLAFSGTAWSSLCSAPGACNPPPARRCAGMAYDVARNRTVMFGGGDDFCDDIYDGQDSPSARQDTWEWNGTAWAQVCTSGCTPPPPRLNANLVYDNGRARSVLIGDGYGDIWEWNGATWIQRSAEGAAPPARRASAIAYDPNRNVIVLFGGRMGSDAVNDFWELNVSPEQRPAVLFDFDWTASGVPRSSVRSVTFHARAGGQGATTDLAVAPDGDTIGEVRSGIQIERWHPNSFWQATTVQSHGIAAPGDISLVASTECGEGLLNSADDHVYARVSPSFGSGNGVAPAEIAVDEADVTVRYTIGLDACP